MSPTLISPPIFFYSFFVGMQFENAEYKDAKRMKPREVLTIIKDRILPAQFDQNDLFLGNQKFHS